MPLTLKDSRSYETQVIDAVRSVNRALGGTYGSSSAIYKSDYNQYEVQLIDAIKGIARTLSGSGLSVYGGVGGDGFVTQDDFDKLTRRVTKLEDESFFQLVDGNITLKDGYENLWVPGWLAAGGVGTGGGEGGVSYLRQLTDVYHDTTGILRANGDAVVNGDVLVYDSTNTRWVAAAAGGGGGSGTVTSVKVGNVAYNPDASGVVTLPAYPSALSQLTADSTHRLVTDTQISTWNAKQDTISDLATIRTGAALGMTALQSESDPTVPSWAKQTPPSLYVGKTQVKTTNTSNDTLIGIDGFTTASSASASGDTSKVVWDSSAGAWHFYGNLYADGWVAAGGTGSGSGGGGGGMDLARMWASLTNSIPDAYTYSQINISHIPSLSSLYLPLSGGTMTGPITMNGANILSSVDSANQIGSVTNRFGSGYFRNLYTSYFGFRSGDNSSQWGNISMGDGYAQIILNTSPNNCVYTFNATYGFFHGGNGAVPCGRDDNRWSNVYSVAGNFSGIITVNGLETIDQSHNDSALFNYGGRKTKAFNAYGNSINLLAHDSSGNVVNQVAVNSQGALFKSGIYPNNVTGLAIGNSGSRWGDLYCTNANLTGSITLGPVTISYDTNTHALHVSGTDGGHTIGFYCDGFVSAGGVGSN